MENQQSERQDRRDECQCRSVEGHERLHLSALEEVLDGISYNDIVSLSTRAGALLPHRFGRLGCLKIISRPSNKADRSYKGKPPNNISKVQRQHRSFRNKYRFRTNVFGAIVRAQRIVWKHGSC